MSTENGKNEPKTEVVDKPKTETPGADIPGSFSGEIHIIATGDGQVQIAAPSNKILAYGLLEIAKDVIRAEPPKKKSPITRGPEAMDILRKLPHPNRSH